MTSWALGQSTNWTHNDNISTSTIVLKRGESGFVDIKPLDMCAIGFVRPEYEGELQDGFLIQRSELLIMSGGRIIGSYGEIIVGSTSLRLLKDGSTLIYSVNGEVLEEVINEELEDVVVQAYNFEGRPATGGSGNWAEEDIILSYALSSGGGSPPPPPSCYVDNAPDIDKNWTQVTIYDGQGEDNCNILSEARTYFDAMGRPVQSQSRNQTDKMVWATETKYDGYGRAVLQSLPAPTNKTSDRIELDPNFFNNQSGQPYNWEQDFDKDFDSYKSGGVGLMSQLGGVNNPTVLSQSDNGGNGSLGWYYSTNNDEEKEIATTNYPYTRTEFSMLTGAQRRVVGPGDVHRMGQGHAGAVYAMRLSKLHELYAMFGTGTHPYNVVLQYDSDDDGAIGTFDYTGTSSASSYTAATMGNKVVKAISIDPDGKETVSFTDLDGNELASCLSGQVEGANVHLQKVSAIIPVGQFRDIHIPQGCSINSVSSFTQGECQGGSGSYTFKVYNLANDQEVVIADLTTLSPGLYRIVNEESIDGTPRICMRVNYTLNYHNFTLSIYNPLKQVIASVPPIGIDYSNCDDVGNTNALDLWSVAYINNPNINSVPDHDHLSLFKYNELGQIHWSQTPDAGRAYFAYAQDGQLRFSQNVKQRNQMKFSYVNYDRGGRVIETGEYSRGTNTSTGTGLYFFSGEAAGAIQYGDYEITTINSLAAEQIFNPNCGPCLIDRTYTTYDIPESGSGRSQRFLMGRVSKTYDGINATWYSYDSEGRITWIAKQVNGISGIKYTDHEYDLLGNVTKVAYQDGQSDAFTHHYTYDAIGQLQVVETEDNQGHREKQAAYVYYQDGSVKSVDYGDGLQELEYTYTIHGWLKGINLDEMNNNSAGSKVFSMALDYYEGDYTPAGGAAYYSEMASGELQHQSYSGNITQWRWKTNVSVSNLSNVNGYFAYKYEYNHRNELKEAQFGNITKLGTTMDFAASPHHKVDMLTYDLNGNILGLRRDGVVGSEDLEKIDKLSYNYIGGTNQLDYIGDVYNFTAADVGDIQNQSVGNYVYSEIGELIEDNSEDIIIAYNSFGKVTSVKQKSTGHFKARYYYDEGGIRVKKSSYDDNGALVKNTFYIYGAGGLQSIYEQPAGGVVAQTEVPIMAGGRIGVAYIGGVNVAEYHYEITDHLGNVRAVIKREVTTLETTYYADYYPFGWTMPGRHGGNSYRYAYQGQEKDEETGWEAFELRMYDGRVGRWMTTDPYSQYHSPYLAMGNNPIGMIDPDGGQGFDFIDIEKSTGEITVTEAEGDDVVRLMNNGTVVDSYTYGENGSFPAVLSQHPEEHRFHAMGTYIIFVSLESEAQRFFLFAAKSDVEFGKLDVQNDVGKVSILTTSHSPTSTPSLVPWVKLYSALGYTGVKQTHSHPDGQSVPSGHYGYEERNPNSLKPYRSNGRKVMDAGNAVWVKTEEGFENTKFEVYNPRNNTKSIYDGTNRARINIPMSQ